MEYLLIMYTFFQYRNDRLRNGPFFNAENTHQTNLTYKNKKYTLSSKCISAIGLDQ